MTISTTNGLPAVVSILQLGTGTLSSAAVVPASMTTNGVATTIGVPISSIMSTGFGALPSGGNTGQILNKTSATSFAATWSNVTQFIAVGTALATSGSATSIVISPATQSGLTLQGVAGTTAAIPAAIGPATADQVLVANHGGTGLAFGPVNLAATAAVSGVLGVPNGGSGTSALTAFGVVFGNGSSAFGATAAGTAGLLLTGNGSALAPSFQSFNIGSALGTGIIGVPNGGTNTSTLTAHGVLIGEGSATVGITAAGTTGWPLVGNGTSLDPTFQVLGLAGGGTNTTTLTAKGVLFGNGTSTVGITAAGATGTVLASPGPAANPAFASLAGGGLSGGTLTNTSTLSALNVVNLAGRFGAFDVWQRLLGSGTTSLAQVASTTSYQNDGWYLITGANQAMTLTQATGIATGSLFGATVQRNAAQTGTTVVRYAAPLDTDELAPAQGNVVGISFTAQAGANWSPASGTISLNVYSGTGSVGKRGATAYSGEVSVIGTSFNLTTTPTRYSAIATAAVATNISQMEIQFSWTPATTAGANDSVTLDDLQLEIVASSSSVASPFVKMDLATQNLKALRWFRVIGGTSSARYGPARTTSTTNGELIFPLVYPMRSAPAVTVFNVTNWVVNDGSVNAAASATASFLTSVDAVNVNLTLATTAGTATPFRPAFFAGSNSTATMFFSSEI